MSRILVPGVVLLLLVAPCAPTSPARADDEDAVTRLLPLGALLETTMEDPVLLLGIPRPTAPLEETLGELRPEPAEIGPFVEDRVLEALLESAVESAVDAAGGDADVDTLEITIRGRHLLVTATPLAHAVIRDVLDRLWLEERRRISLDVHWLNFDADALGRLAQHEARPLEAVGTGRCATVEVEALLAEAARPGSRRASVSGRVPAGCARRLGQLEAISYLSDYDIEIAQDSRVGNPVVHVLRTGVDAHLRAFPLQDGGVFLEGTVQAVRTGRPFRSLALDVEPLGTLDMPACDVLRFSTACRVAPRVAAAWMRAREAGGGLDVLLIAPRQDAVRVGGGGSHRFDVSSLASPRRGWWLRPAWMDDTGGVAPPFLLLERGAEDDPPIWEVEDLAGVLTGGDDWRGEDPWLYPTGTGLLARNEPAALARLETLLADLEAEARSSRHLRLRLTRTGADGRETEVAALGTHVPVGEWAGWLAGREEAFLADWDVEVAVEERAGDPLVGVVFAGLALNVRLEASAAGSPLGVHLQVEHSRSLGPLTIRQPKNECTGVIESPSVGLVGGVYDLLMVEGEPTSFPVATLEDGSHLVLEVRVGR